MNWRLLVYLSFFGLVMAMATVNFIPQAFEPILWIFIFGFCAYSIAKHCDDRYFIHGFLLSIINCIYLTAFHTAFWESYSSAHDSFVNMLPAGPSQRAAAAAAGVMIGVVSGIVQGLFCVVAAKMRNKSQPA